MKLIILESGDNLGKNTLIKSLCEYYNYDNVTVRHFGKPPKNLSSKEVLDFQFKRFIDEANLIKHIREFEAHKEFYYENIVIWNRSYLGEYVYAQLFRNADAKTVKTRLINFEKLKLINEFDDILKIYLVSLTADPKFFLEKEDGLSFSKTLEEKTKELELFKEAHNFSLIENKILIKVDKDGKFRTREEIFQEMINFIMYK